MNTPPNEPYVSGSTSAGGSASSETSGPDRPGGSTPRPPILTHASREQRGVALVGAGAVVLFISLFLNWYEPGRSAWTVFEVWDLVLAVLSVLALVGAAGRLGIVQRRPDSWLTGPAVASFVIVLVSLINHPPAATGAGPMFGLWLALVASIVMLIGVAISVARVSVAINLHPHSTPSSKSGDAPATGRARAASGRGHWFRHAPAAPPSAAPEKAPAAEAPTEVTRPQTGRPSEPPQAPRNAP